MSMFSKIRNKDKKAAKEEEARAAECRQALEGVLRSYNCELKPVLYTTPHGILPDIQIYPLEQPKHEPGADASIAGQAKADEQATRNGAPIDQFKVS